MMMIGNSISSNSSGSNGGEVSKDGQIQQQQQQLLPSLHIPYPFPSSLDGLGEGIGGVKKTRGQIGRGMGEAMSGWMGGDCRTGEGRNGGEMGGGGGIVGEMERGMTDDLMGGEHLIDPDSFFSPTSQGDLISALGMDDLW